MVKNFEVGFVAEHASQNLADIEAFAKTVDSIYHKDVLTGLSVFLWTASDAIGFWLYFDEFDPADRDKFQEWMNRYQVKVLEVMHKPKKEKDELLDQFLNTADMRFVGGFDLDMAFRAIEARLREFGKIL